MGCKGVNCQEIVVEKCDADLCDFETLAACVKVDTTGFDCIPSTPTDLQSILKVMCNESDADWYQAETTKPPQDISKNIYTKGKVGIGIDKPTFSFHVVGNTLIDFNDIEFIVGNFTKTPTPTFGTAITGDGFTAGHDTVTEKTGIYAVKDFVQLFTDNTLEAASVGALQGGGITKVLISTRDATDISKIEVFKASIVLESDTISGVDGTKLTLTKTDLSIDDTDGFTGTVANPTSITVLKGIVTNVVG